MRVGLSIAARTLRGAADTMVRAWPALAASCLVAAGSNWLLLRYVIRAHLELGRTGSLLQDFGWDGAAWILFVVLQNLVAGAYAAALAVCAAQRSVLLGARAGARALVPGRAVLGVTGAVLALLLVPIAGLAAVGLYRLLAALMGWVSAELTMVLLALPSLAAAGAMLRLALLPASLVLRHRFAAAESWHVSRGHTRLIGAVLGLAVAPPLLALVLIRGVLPPNGFATQVILEPLAGVACWLMAGSACAALYLTLQTGPAEEERPSRVAALRREPWLRKVNIAAPRGDY